MDTLHNQGSQIFESAAPVVYASFWERFGAWIIDMLILSVAGYFINRMMGYNMFEGYSSRDDMFKYYYSGANFATIAVNWLYYALQESGPVQATLGKRALGIRVMRAEGGGRISFGQATGRYFGKYVSAIILLIGYLMVLWDDKRQALHDKMAGTLVVKQ